MGEILVNYGRNLLHLILKFLFYFSDVIAGSYNQLDEEDIDQNDRNNSLDDGKDRGIFMYEKFGIFLNLVEKSF